MITGLEIVCAVCSTEYIHLEEVRWVARREDEPQRLGSVDLYSGRVFEPVFVPTDKLIGEGRRQRASLLFSCEDGHHTAVTFTQHKGETLVDVENYVEPRPHSTEEYEALMAFDPRRWLRSRRWGEILTWR